MTYFWKKLGQLYQPKKYGQHPKLISHAANPVAVYLRDDIFRIFFSGRDEKNRSSVGGVDVDIIQQKIIAEHYLPFFEHGSPGSFYADGVSIGNCYEARGIHYMLFMGWQRPSNDHWRGDIGRLIVNSDFTLTLDKNEPLLGRDQLDPVSLSYPWVLPNSSNGFEMWFGSTISWDAGNGEMLHIIKHAKSIDGNNWVRTGITVPYEIGTAQAFSRPTVVKNKHGDFDMWFSYRGGVSDAYRIGYASSKDGLNWSISLENSGINVSNDGWDSEMIEYPFVFDHKGSRYMLYNGNSYGKSGFGLAILQCSS